MQAIEFKVVSIGVRDECLDVELHAKRHPVFTSVVFLHLLPSQLSKFSIGQIYSLTAQDWSQVIETVPLDAVRSRFEDGSPVPDEPTELELDSILQRRVNGGLE